MTNVEIFGFAPSTYTQTALLVATEKGVPHTLSPVVFGAESHRALHPFARMPAMKHRDIHLYETAAIAIYLDEAFDGPSLQPKTALDRARMWQFVSSAVDYYYAPLVGDRLGLAEDATPDPAPRDHVLDLLEATAAKGDYLVGDDVTLADLMIAPMVRFHAEAAKADNPLAKRPNLANWLNRLSARASFKTLEAA